nr:uncharacterized protein LOC129263426 [Lytechinus pictus]
MPLPKTDEYSDVQVYFTANEWADISDYERICIQNVKENYEMMIEVGVQVNPPMFMQRQQGIHKEIIEETEGTETRGSSDIHNQQGNTCHTEKNELHKENLNTFTIKVEAEYDDDGNLLGEANHDAEGKITDLEWKNFDEITQTQTNPILSGDQRTKSGDLIILSCDQKAEEASGGSQSPTQFQSIYEKGSYSSDVHNQQGNTCHTEKNELHKENLNTFTIKVEAEYDDDGNLLGEANHDAEGKITDLEWKNL